MRILLLLILLEASCLVVFGQSGELDSIEQSLSQKGDRFKARYFVNLATKKLEIRSSDALDYAQKAVSLASRTKNWQLEAAALRCLGKAHLQNRDTVPAIISFTKEYELNADHKDSLGMALADLTLARLYLHGRDAKQGEHKVLSALSIYQSAKDTIGMANCYLLKADFSQKLDHLSKANENLRIALSFLNKKADSDKEQIQLFKTHIIQDKRIRGLLFVLIGIAGFLAAMLTILYKKKQFDNHKLALNIAENQKHRAEIEELAKELEQRNISLDLLNKQLVSEMAEREKLQGFSHSKDRYLSAITHEMRSPLNDLAGLAQLLLDNNPRPDQVDQIRVLQFCANELTSLTNEALGYSSFDEAKFGNNNMKFNLEDLTNQVFNRVETLAASKSIHFYHSFDELIPKWLTGNGARLSNILSNLLASCVETTDAGLVRCTVILETRTERNAVLKIVIEAPDKGLLSNFYQHKHFPKESTKAIDDKVLGLAMTKRMVEVQNGKMQVENLLEEATRFTLLMPFDVSNQKHILRQTEEGHYIGLEGAKVLMVEDNKINQVVVVNMLRKYGALVSTAENGFEALDLLSQQAFDIVLMDIQMPGMDGYRATSEIRKNPSMSINSLPIIALTSSAYIIEKEKALLFGMNDYVGKPFCPSELLDKINECLEVSRT